MKKLAYSIEETAEVLSIGRTSVYNLIGTAKLETFRIGRRNLVTGESIQKLIDTQR